MKRVLSVSLLTLCLLIPAAYADEKEAVAKAQRAATAGLALTDGGKYPESWDSSAALFKAAITKPDWKKALKSATFARSLPGAPAGESVVVQSDAQFENNVAAIESSRKWVPSGNPDSI